MKSQEISAASCELAPNGEEALPRRFGRLTLLRRLARGGMGEVYLASTGGIEGAERPCVVKIIRREHASDRSFRARFLDETRIQAQLQHPGVAQILEAATTGDDCPYAVVEYVEGRHLGEVLTRAAQLGLTLGWEDAVGIGIAFGDALAHVHERTDASGRPLEIAHRDLSPQNVMVGYAGDLKLIDFGTAKGENRRCRTVSGIVFAKPGYVAPEVANQTPGGPAADLYAFGVMLWELARGRRFLQGDPVEHQALVARGERSPARIAAELGAPPELDDVIAGLTATKVEDRYATARIAVSELVAVLKRAPSLANGDRSVRGRIAHLMQRLYPAEPARSRADFARRAAQARQLETKDRGVPAPSPEPPAAEQDSVQGLLPGTRYRLVRPLGAGAMGEVYEAHHVDLGRAVAVKVLPREAATSADRRQRFRSEARAIARLDNPGLVKLHDFGQTADGRFYYAMELLAGESLDRRLRKGPLEWSEAVQIASKACEALEAAHRAGVIHRDITPSNLFLVEGGGVKLLDFGVARFVSEVARDGEHSSLGVVGTPEYMSPEQAAGAEGDERSDIYSLGAVLYEMITGLPPHWIAPGGNNDVAQLLTAKISATPLSPRVCAPDRAIPRWLDELVTRALSRDAERRFGTARVLREALDSPKSDRALLRRRVRRVGAAAAAMLGAACVFALGYGALHRASPEKDSAPWQAELNEGRPGQDPSAVMQTPVVEDDDELALELEVPKAHPATEETPSAPEVVAAAPADEKVKAVQDEPKDEVAERVAKNLLLVEQGQRIKGYNFMKRLAEQHPERADVQRALSISSVAVKAWGDALKAATEWVKLEPSAAARLHLAKMEKATVRGDAVKTLEVLLSEQPANEEARRLLDEYRRDRLARR